MGTSDMVGRLLQCDAEDGKEQEMVKTFNALLLSSTLLLSVATAAMAQSASTVGAGSASGTRGTIGTAGSAAAGGTSASTLGTGGTSTGTDGTTSSTLGTGGSAAAVDGKATSKTKIHQNPNMLHGQSRARAQDGGTWSRSHTRTKIKDGELQSRTRSMSHEPGGAPVKSTTKETVNVGQQ